ncbi:MAG: DUF2339 domain-containing protein [Opitutaceae bacterium]|nr:DUF2339 domain-containing protein [Opitutaceae bacterium]
MNDEIVLILFVLLGIAALLLVMPIVALVKASGARREATEVRERLKTLEADLAALQRRITEGAPVAPAPAAPIPAPSAPAATPAAAPVPVVLAARPPPIPEIEATPIAPPPIPLPEEEPAFARVTTPPPIDDIPAPIPDRPHPSAHRPPLPPIAAETKPAFNWEQFMGVKLFAWLGGGALLVTAIFFLKYSFEHNWIPASVRAALGFITAAGLVVGGLWSIRRNFVTTGQSLTATGIVMLYAVTFACRAYYKFDFFAGPAAGALMVLITVTAFLLAVRLDAQVVAILGLLGGFLTPVMLSTGVDNAPGLFGFIALLDIGLLAVVLHRRWNYLSALAACGTVLMQLGWAGKFFELAKLPTAVVVLVVFAALFALAVFVARRLGRASDWLAASALLPPFVALGFSFYFSCLPAVAGRAGWVLGNIFFADLALLAVCALHRPFARVALLAGLASFGVAAVWIGAAVTEVLLPWALGFVVIAAALHSVFPFVQERLHPGSDARRWSALFPPLGLLVLLIPLAQLEEVGWWIWPVVLLLNLFALAAAALTRALAALGAALLLTLLVLGVAISQLPTGFSGGGRELLLIAGFSIFFCAGTLWLLRRFGGKLGVAAPDWSAYLPDATAALPFVLLVMLVFKLRQPDPSMIFGVVLLLGVLLYGIAVVARRGAPVLAAFAGTLLVEYCWWGEWSMIGDKGVALAWFQAFALAFLVVPFLLRRRLLEQQVPWAVAALALPLHFFLIHRGFMKVWPNDVPGALAAICALPPLFGLIVLLRLIPADAPYRLNRLAWFGASTLFFITLIFPLQFSLHWITIGWALEGAALLWLFHRIPHPGLRVAGVALLVAVFARLLINPAVLHYASRSPTPVFNWILLTYGAATVCCFAGLRLLAPPRDRVLGFSAPALLGTLGTILAFALVNLEIADYFTPPGAYVSLKFSGNFARDMSYTIAWALFALVLLLAGIRQHLRAVRYAAIALLCVAFLKLIVHDFAHLDQIFRIAASFVVAVVALAASFLFARFLRSNPDPKS